MNTLKGKDVKVMACLTTPVLLLVLLTVWHNKVPNLPQKKDLIGVWQFEEEGVIGYMYLTEDDWCYMSFPPSFPDNNGRWHFFNESEYQLNFDTIKFRNGRSFIISNGMKVIEPRDPRTTLPLVKESYSKIIKWDSQNNIMQIETETSNSITRIFTKVRESDFPDKKYTY